LSALAPDSPDGEIGDCAGEGALLLQALTDYFWTFAFAATNNPNE